MAAADASTSRGVPGSYYRSPVIAALCLLMLMQLVGSALAQSDVVITASGIGAVLADEGAARDEALRDAMRRAVEQAVGAAVSGRTLMVDMQVVEDRVSSRAAGFVSSYRVLEEGRHNDVYRVSIEATVQSGLIANDLESVGALLRVSLGNPRVLVLATRGPGQFIDQEAERYVIDHFVALQFPTYNANALGTRSGPPSSFEGADLAAMAREAQADIVVVASVTMTSLGSTKVGATSVSSARASVQLQAVLARTGQVLASRTSAATDATTHGALAQAGALQSAISDMLPGFTQDMIRVLNDSVVGTGGAQSIQVTVNGVTDFLAALKIRDLLAGVRGVTTLQQRSFDGSSATYDVQGSATTQDLAIRLLAEDGWPVKVTYLDAQRLEVRVEEP